MGVPGNADLLLLKTAAAAGGYQVSRSLRFDAASTSYLSRTPGSAGTRTTYTLSVWVKRAALTTRQMIFSANNGGDSDAIYFHEDNTLRFFQRDGLDSSLITTQVFRDASAWYHIVLAVDTTQGTSSNRVKLYVNGTQITTFSTASYPSSSYTGGISNTVAHNIGRRSSASDNYLDAYLADAWFLDGIAATPSDFAETDATTGQWIPKTYSGSKGSNGFHLEFADNSAATAAALGKDTSGNSPANNWTPTNFSVTAGAGNDSLVDTPTSVSATDTGIGGEIRGNYCTLNPLDSDGTVAYANGNLEATVNAGSGNSTYGTFSIKSGKWYWEIVISGGNGSSSMIGVAEANKGTARRWTGANGWYYYETGVLYNNLSSTSYGASYTNGDVIGVALDMDNGNLVFYKNGTSQGTAYSAGTFSGKEMMPAFGNGGGANVTYTLNAGQRAFAYTAPSGFKALCDTNLTAPVIAKPNTVFDVVLRTSSTATSKSVTGLNFSPDLLWEKPRSIVGNHWLADSIRGITKTLSSNTTNAEATYTSFYTSFNSDGYTIGTDDFPTGTSVVGWVWDAGTSTVTNNVGSITSSVRANASAGFSIVSYNSGSSTGNFTLGHGLNVAPKFIIHKSRSTSNWWVYHASVVDDLKKYMQLNSTNAIATNSNNMWGGAFPTSSVFGVTVGDLIGTSQDAIAYVFSPVAGYSSAFSYTGNGSSDGPMIWLGFKPRLILLKRSDSANNWILVDTARDTYNSARYQLLPNVSDSEYTVVDTLDVLSNGFKVRDTNASRNASGGTYIGFAWAENPFQYARAR